MRISNPQTAHDRGWKERTDFQYAMTCVPAATVAESWFAPRLAPFVLHDMYSDVGSVIGSYVSHSRWIELCPTGVLYALNLSRETYAESVVRRWWADRKVRVPLVGHAADAVAEHAAVCERTDYAERDGGSECRGRNHFMQKYGANEVQKSTGNSSCPPRGPHPRTYIPCAATTS